MGDAGRFGLSVKPDRRQAQAVERPLDVLTAALLKHSPSALSIHAFLSGGGLRVVSMQRAIGGELAYGEAPNIEDALAYLAEDYLAGGRKYSDVYGEDKLHPAYLTGSSKPSSPLDAHVRRGCTFDASARGELVQVVLNGWGEFRFPADVMERVKKTGKRERFTTRARVWEVEPAQFPSGEWGVSGRVVYRPADADHVSDSIWRTTRTASAPDLRRAFEMALDAPEHEVAK